MSFYIALHRHSTTPIRVQGSLMIARELSTLHTASQQMNQGGMFPVTRTESGLLIDVQVLRCPLGVPYLPLNADVGLIRPEQVVRNQERNVWEFVPYAYLRESERDSVRRHRAHRRNFMSLDPELPDKQSLLSFRADDAAVEDATNDTLGAPRLTVPSTATENYQPLQSTGSFGSYVANAQDSNRAHSRDEERRALEIERRARGGSQGAPMARPGPPSRVMGVPLTTRKVTDLRVRAVRRRKGE